MDDMILIIPTKIFFWVKIVENTVLEIMPLSEKFNQLSNSVSLEALICNEASWREKNVHVEPK